jgi:hypothetical protein
MLSLRGASALANDPTPLALGRTTPDTFLLARGEGMFQACDAHITSSAHGDGHLGTRLVTLVGEEDRWIQTLAGTFLSP